MWTDFLIISIWGGIVSSDTTAAFQIMISHPIVSCAVVGLLLGNFPLGFTIGIVLELVWLYEIPTGAAQFSEGNVGATVAAATAIFSTAVTGRETVSTVISLFVAMGVALIAGQLVGLMRTINTKNYDRLLNQQIKSMAQVQRVHLLGLLFSFLLGFLVTMVSLVLLVPRILPQLIELLPVSFDRYLEPVIFAFLGVGCGVLLFLFKDHNKWWLIFVGLLAGLGLFFLL